VTSSPPAARPPAPDGRPAPRARAAGPGAAGDGVPAAARRPWPVRRLLPLLATAGLVLIGMASTTWWGPAMVGKTAWGLPDDLWGTLVAAQRLAHLDLAGLYTKPTGLVSLPGAAVILVPAAAIIEAAGFSLQVPGAHNPQPAAWLVAGPYQMAVSGLALFAADAIAERLGASLLKRALLAGAGAVTLWSVSVLWGHPEDAVAVGLLLFAILALSDGRAGGSAWLTGAAVAVQPLVLLALPVIAMVVEPRRLPGYLTRAAAPGVLLLAAAAVANWTATVHAVTSQPNWPGVDHPTPWDWLAPHLSGGAVAAGPARIVAILVACGCALRVGRRWPEARRLAPWRPQILQDMLWWVAVTLALRSLFEPVMVAYYLWPVLAVALIAASTGWTRLITTSVVTSTVTFVSQLTWRGPWTWWSPMVAGLAVTLILARFPRSVTAPGPAPVHRDPVHRDPVHRDPVHPDPGLRGLRVTIWSGRDGPRRVARLGGGNGGEGGAPRDR
jgi:hypothetical protein